MGNDVGRAAETDDEMGGLEGVYTQMAGEVRAVILLNFLGSAQRIVVPAKVLERLPASAAA